jgi:hypothetical protein
MLPPFGLKRRPARAYSSAPEAPTALRGSVGDRRGGDREETRVSHTLGHCRRAEVGTVAPGVCDPISVLPLASVIYTVYPSRPRALPIPLAAPRVNATHPRLARLGALSPRRGWHSGARDARIYIVVSPFSLIARASPPTAVAILSATCAEPPECRGGPPKPRCRPVG